MDQSLEEYLSEAFHGPVVVLDRLASAVGCAWWRLELTVADCSPNTIQLNETIIEYLQVFYGWRLMAGYRAGMDEVVLERETQPGRLRLSVCELVSSGNKLQFEVGIG